MNAKVGFIVCGVHSEVKDVLGRPMIDVKLVEDSLNSLRNAGLDVYRVYGVLSKSLEIEKAVEECEKQGVDCVVFYVATWLWASEIWKAVYYLSIPTLIWCTPTSIGWATGGALVLHGALDEVGVKHKIVYGYPDDGEALKSIVSFARAAKAANRLKKTTLGLIGGYSMGAVTGAVDMAQVLSKFGVKIEHVDQYELVNSAKAIPKEEVEETYRELRRKYGRLPELDEVMERSIRLYIALKKLVSERKYDAVAVKCFPELGDNYATACLAQSLLPDEGIVTSCIGDVNTALSAYILYLLSGKPTFNPDVQQIRKWENVVKLASDGAAPISLAEDVERMTLKRRGLPTEGAADGICVGFVCKPGPVTMLRLCRIKGEYCMHIATGEAFIPKDVDVALEECGFPHWPHAFIKLSGDVEKFIQNQRSEYISMCYGDYERELIDLCYILDIKPLLDK
ncbi:L-fucose/L-arabinose isomerase family protein [Candidatus Bathyarchaeota archaeon]|nr:L-fucose/L-arabinose isomerase family protein [Candidatus Bathyarchaeota archaeon]